MIFRIKIIILVVIIIHIVQGCEKPRKHILPDTNVNIAININNAAYIALKAPGGYKIIDGGLNGIIVYRIDNSKFGAYERTCPYKPEDNCKVDVNGALVKCPCCSSRFSLLDGSLIDGPAEWPLKEYTSGFDGVYLLITN